ncbi:MAG: bile acid:sodium symporter family protein [Pseudomonadota bacterium]
MGQTIVTVILPLSLAYIMFTLGIGLRISDFTAIAKFPKAFFVGVLNQGILLPILGFILAAVIALPPQLAVGVVLLALCPGGVTTNLVAKLANGNVALSVSLTAVMTIVSVITLPIFLNIAFQQFMGATAPEFSLISISIRMFLIAVVPLVLGMIVRAIFPAIETKAGRILLIIATILFALIVLAAIATNWDLIISNIGQLGFVLVLLLVLSLIMGMISGRIFGLNAADTSTVAIETGVQNGTLAIAVAALIGAGGTIPEFGIPGALYGPIMYLSLFFAVWRRKAA